MTEKRTLSLNGRQWRVLLHDNLDVLKAVVQQTEKIDEAGLRNICAQLDDMKMLAGAWYQVGKEPEPVAAPANGAMPKKRGRPRKVDAQAMQ